YSDGLHQAIEAKENVKVEGETQTLATITIQNYFRLYDKLAGMTGTAETEAAEFSDIYKLDVAVIPTNKPCVRADHNDIIYKTRREKFNAIIKEIEEHHKNGQPVLVGTVNVEVSELLSRMLKRTGVVHSVLNAKYHQMVAEIIARAGQRGACTIATNMAGRGTDIKLGPGVPEVGGLHVLATERHEARRIDRQLRGRCARQGDPGSSRFYISLEDDLMRLFGSGRIAGIMEKVGMEEGEPLESRLLNRSIETAQKRVEQHNFSIRKRTLEYDDVMNKQREVIYGFRNEVLRTDNPRQMIFNVIEEVLADKLDQYLPEEKDPQEWDVTGLLNWANLTFPLGLRREQLEPVLKQAAAARTGKKGDEAPDPAYDFLHARVKAAYAAKEANEDPMALQTLERYVVLNAIDRLWQEHLYNMDSLRMGIGLRAQGQRDPLVEYKIEAFKLFEEMQGQVKSEIANNTFRSSTSLAAFEKFLAALPKQMLHAQSTAFGGGASAAPQHRAPAAPRADAVEEAIAAAAKPVRRDAPKVGRNEPCPCGSGKKFKHCCGK
ncbi:MAG: SEC-C domain-containing protein, partial [Verrucomicrobia bacterium]|nr:SEC-C domain-containing protein [Verrucomicrobiota bacterium]